MHQAAGGSLAAGPRARRGAGTVPALTCAGKPDTWAGIRVRGRRLGRRGTAHRGAGARLLALWLTAAAAVPAFAQQPAPTPAELAAAEPEWEQILVAGEYRYARSRRAGVFVSFDGGLTWQPRSAGLPHRVVYPFPDPPEYAAVTSLAADPANPRRLAATTASGVYLTTNGGMAWQRVATDQVHPHAYFTSVALSPHDPAGMLLGTSFHGVYETTDGGANWHHLKRAIRFLTDRSLFYEEVAGLSYDPAAPRAMVLLAGFDGGIFYVADRFAEERDTPGTGLLRFTVPAMATIQLGYAPAGDAWELHAGTVDAGWRLTTDGSWEPIGAAEPLRRGIPLQPQEPAPAPATAESAEAAEAPPPTESDPGPAGQPAGAGEPADAAPGAAPPAADRDATTAATGDAAQQPAAATGGAPTDSAPAAADAAAADPAPEAGTTAASETTLAPGQPASPAAGTSPPASPSAADGPDPAAVAAADAAPQADTDAGSTATATPTALAVSDGETPPPPADSDQAGVSYIAAGLPQVPPPECTTPAQPGGGGAAQHAAHGHAAAAQDTGQPDAAQAATAATAAASQAPEGAASQVAARPPAAPATAADAGHPDAEHCGDEHMLAAGEPGWIAGPEGIGAAAPLPRAALRNGIYIRADRAVAALPEYLDLLARHGLDSIVIDFKTDDGRLTYDSELPLARAMGAAPGPIKLDRLIADAHAAGIYVIARLVVFKDPFLFDWDNHRLAIWDTEQAGPWRHLVPAGDDSNDDSGDKVVQREHWVDPFAPEVWQYNVAVAEELAARGVDEIQFDYIRFPSDGPTERATYRHRRPGMRRVDAIESFLALARERLQVPISTDLFGFNSWYRAGNFIGQDIDVLSEYADVISPMFYPSHFPNHFLDDRSYTERAYAIYEAGVRRAQRMVRGRAFIRPYVQAFLIGRELRMEEEEYSRYLTRQLDGNRAAAGSGFTLWNASNRYYMVTEPLQPYFDTRREETP